VKVGDLVSVGPPGRWSMRDVHPSRVFLVVRVSRYKGVEVIWLYPDPDGNPDYDHTDDDNYYFKRWFEVVNESR
jgi:hypothetical protein